MHSSPNTPATHPIVLHPDLDADDTRAPQTQFVVERQVAFLEALATTGSVRAAAARARVSHQTCLLYTSPSPRDRQKSRMPSSA